ncbi:hypothetical protein BDZ91DRAFT_826247 [Kalaharituber pfeilii]|nr:hypothetical protein BDZ91DRAFT_826247 [Kalaharituber pfeilii]
MHWKLGCRRTIVQAISGALSLAIRIDRILSTISRTPGKAFYISHAYICKALLCNCTLPENQNEINPLKPTVLSYPITGPAAERYYLEHPFSLPPIFVEALRRYHQSSASNLCDGLWEEMTINSVGYWWRAQAAAFILRLKESAMQHVRDMRMNKLGHGSNPSKKQLNVGRECPSEDKRYCKLISMPFPLARGSLSLHIYFGCGDFITRNPLRYKYTGFISTEDPDVLVESQTRSLTHPPPKDKSEEWSRAPKWTWYWSDIPRLNVGPEEQLVKLGGGNRTEMTLSWMLQLMMALEADGWVGTRGKRLE